MGEMAGTDSQAGMQYILDSVCSSSDSRGPEKYAANHAGKHQ